MVIKRQGLICPWSGARIAARSMTSNCSAVGAGSCKRGTETRFNKSSRASIINLLSHLDANGSVMIRSYGVYIKTITDNNQLF